MGVKKATEFIVSDEHLKIIREIGEFFKIPWNDKKISDIINLTSDILRYNITSENQVKELIKKWLDYLNEEEINNFYQVLRENFLTKVEELWKAEDEERPASLEEKEETMEERERRYLELMKTLVKYPQKPIEGKPEKKEQVNEETEKFKTITFEPKEEDKKEIVLQNETAQEILPEGTIVITRKKEETEEKPKEKKEEFLDLSGL